MGAILDDMDSRPGSATSLLRTVIGSYLRDIGGWIAVADLVRFLEALDIPAPRTRTALVRVKQKGLLVNETRDRTAGYRIQDDAVPMLARGDRRIYHPRFMEPGDPWCLLSFSIPEENRSLRHQLRRRLYWIGCGTVAPALWICPAFLVDEVEEILDDVGLRRHATSFITQDPRTAGTLAEAVAQWWDLDAIRELHEDFTRRAGPLIDGGSEEKGDEGAFAAYMTSIDTWRIIPYLDPGLSLTLLPADWPGVRSVELFAAIGETYREASDRFVRSVTSRP